MSLFKADPVTVRRIVAKRITGDLVVASQNAILIQIAPRKVRGFVGWRGANRWVQAQQARPYRRWTQIRHTFGKSARRLSAGERLAAALAERRTRNSEREPRELYTITRSTPGNSRISSSCRGRLNNRNRLPDRPRTTWVIPYSFTKEIKACATCSCFSKITSPPIF